MNFLHHKRNEAVNVCNWCGEEWPCTVRKVVVEVAEHIKPRAEDEPMCCNECAKGWDTRNNIAEELIDGE